MAAYLFPGHAPMPLPAPISRELAVQLVGGPVELVQLDAHNGLLIHEHSREQEMSKNLAASALWFERHTESGQASDFILGPVIHCRNEDLTFDPLDHQPLKSVLTDAERKQLHMNGSPVKVFTPEQALACSLDNPDGCEACGS